MIKVRYGTERRGCVMEVIVKSLVVRTSGLDIKRGRGEKIGFVLRRSWDANLLEEDGRY